MATVVLPNEVQESQPSHFQETLQQELCCEQAEQLEALLPMLFLRLFTLEPEHPATEMSPTQLRICTVLHQRPCSMSHLSEEVGVKVSSMTRIADRMERDGLVERVSEPEDRRLRFLRLSPYGIQVMDSRKQYRLRRVEEALAHIEEPFREEVLRVFQTLLVAAIAATNAGPLDGIELHPQIDTVRGDGNLDNFLVVCPIKHPIDQRSTQ